MTENMTEEDSLCNSIVALEEKIKRCEEHDGDECSLEMLQQARDRLAHRAAEPLGDEQTIDETLGRIELEILGYLVLGAATITPTVHIAEVALSLRQKSDPEGDILDEIKTVLRSAYRITGIVQAFGLFSRRLLQRDEPLSEEERAAVRAVLREWFHLFNNILVGVTSYAELLQEDLPPLSERLDLAKRIERLGQRVGRLVGQRAGWQIQTTEMMEGPWASMASERELLLQLLTWQDIPLVQHEGGEKWPDEEGLAAVRRHQSRLASHLTDEIMRRLAQSKSASN